MIKTVWLFNWHEIIDGGDIEQTEVYGDYADANDRFNKKIESIEEFMKEIGIADIDGVLVDGYTIDRSDFCYKLKGEDGFVNVEYYLWVSEVL